MTCTRTIFNLICTLHWHNLVIKQDFNILVFTFYIFNLFLLKGLLHLKLKMEESTVWPCKDCHCHLASFFDKKDTWRVCARACDISCSMIPPKWWFFLSRMTFPISIFPKWRWSNNKTCILRLFSVFDRRIKIFPWW